MMVRNIKKRMLALLDTVIELLLQLPERKNQAMLLDDTTWAMQTIATSLKKEEELSTQREQYVSRILAQVEELKRKEVVKETQLLLHDVVALQNSIKEIKAQIKIAFMPYKIQMWGTLASIYNEATKDPDCVVQVIPLPYDTLGMNKDGTVYKEKTIYEGEEFAKRLPIIYYSEYSVEQECPDIIFLHNIYDGYNNMTRVHEEYWTSDLKNYTEQLVYVPYFISSFVRHTKEDAEFWFGLPSLQNVNKIVVAGEYVKQAAISYGLPEEKLLALGSPKIDSIVEQLKTDLTLPAGWEERLQDRKVFFLNTLYHILGYEGVFEDVLSIPERFENTAVIWRPHPLTEAFIESRYPAFLPKYKELKAKVREGRGAFQHIVLDEEHEYFSALKRADVMISGISSLLNAFLLTEKPVIFLDKQMPKTSMLEKETFDYYTGDKEQWNQLIAKLCEGKEDEKKKELRHQASQIYANIDGTCGQKVYQTIKAQLED